MTTTHALSVTIGLGLLLSFGCAQRQPEGSQGQTGPVVQDRRFSGSVQIQTPSGPSSVRVEITNISIRGGYTLDRLELPFAGTLMVHLQAGEVTTIVDGKREERKQGQIWTIPPGVSMGLATGRDSASLQTTLVER